MTDHSNVKLGLMPPLTGLVGIYGTEIERAGRIACAEVNEQGGVLGRPLELVVEDDGSLPESAVAAATRLVEEHRCVSIIGNLLSNSRIAVAYRVAEPRKTPLLNFSFYEGSIMSRYFFHFAALPNQQIDKMIPYMRDRFGPRMFFAGNNYEWPRGSIDAAKRALLNAGGKVLGELYTPIGVSRIVIDDLLDKVEQASPDVFVPYFAGADQVTLLTRFTERGLKQRMAVVMGHYDELMASKLPPEVREGFYSSNTYFMTVQTRENQHFLTRLARYKGVTGIWPDGNGILTNFGEGAYVCVKAFAKAANLAGTLDAEGLVDALNTLTITGPQGELHMDPITQHARVNTYLTRCDARGTFEIVEEFGAVDPQIPERYSHQRINHQATLEDDIRVQSRMLENMSEGVMLFESHEQRILYANAGAERLFGYDRGELIGISRMELDVPQIDMETGKQVDIGSALAQQGGWQGELCKRRKDGTSVWCDASFSVFTHPIHGEVWLAVYNDMTARKQAEQELLASEERLRRVIDATNDGIWDWNILTHENYLSPRWKAILGYADGELENVDSTFFELIHPDDQASVSAAVTRHFDQREPYAIEVRMRHKNGDYRWILARGEAIRDEGGKPVRMVGTISDITGRKQAESALIESEARLRRAESLAHIGHFEFDANGGNFVASEQLKNIFGFAEGCGNQFEDYPPRIHPDDYDQVVSGLKQAIDEKRGYDMEYRILHQDGKVLNVHAVSQLVPGLQGTSPRFFGALIDITEHKQAEENIRKLSERLDLATRAAGIGIWDWDVSTNTLNWDEQMFALHGVVRKDFAGAYEAWLAVLHPDDSVRCHTAVQDALLGKAAYSIDFRVCCPDGTVRYIKADGQVIRDKAGQPVRMIGTNYDITAQKLTEYELLNHRNHLEELVSDRTTELKTANEELKISLEQLRQAQNQLVQSEKMASLGGMVAGVAHEINTPVGVGITAISHLQMKLDDYATRYESGQLTRSDFESLLRTSNESSRIILGNLERAAGLIHSFKQVAVDQASNEARSFNMLEYLQEIIQSLHPRLNVGGHRVEIDCPPHIVMHSHPGALSQVLTNLVINSLVHGFDDRQGGLITVHVSDRSAQKIRLLYTDNGKGIPPENLKRIFDPFFTTRRNQGGTGLGMHIVFNLITQTLGGHISVSSELDKGVEFEIILPVGTLSQMVSAAS